MKEDKKVHQTPLCVFLHIDSDNSTIAHGLRDFKHKYPEILEPKEGNIHH
jgi:hypothetical protein